MTRQWGVRSQEVYNTLDPRLQQVMDFVLIVVADISLISGQRTEDEQNKLYAEGKSQLRFPQSKHNHVPLSHAVDFQPYPMPNINATDPKRREKARKELWASLAYVAGAARVFAYANGVRLRWGGDWDMDGDLTDNNFDDLFHLELHFEEE